MIEKDERNCRKIKIALFVWTLEGMGGSERVVYDIARKLNKRRFTPIVISYQEGPVRKLYEDIGVRVFIVPKNKGFDLRSVVSLRRLLVRESVQVINAHHLMPFFYAFVATRWSGIKLVCTEHSVWQIEELNPALKSILKFLLKRTDAVVAVSRQLISYYLEKMPYLKTKARLVLNGVDLNRFGRTERACTKGLIGLPGNARIVGIVANIRPEKNHKLLISAFSKLARENKQAHLVVVGLDCMNGEIQRFARENYAWPRIHFLGPRDDVPDLLKIFDVFCLPSVHEGLPLTLLEAMASGVPVVGTDVVGINEVITANDNGILVPPNDEDSLKEAIKKVFKDNNLKKKLSSNGFSYVVKHHDLDKKIYEYENLFESLCSGARCAQRSRVGFLQ
ncbi:MAG: glycosyltransferase [Nitrososphaera sp.]|nr:glycosyltransferase [Nitrososphaera sp.]